MGIAEQAAQDIKALVEENERLQKIVQLVSEYDDHRLHCTSCCCGLHCPVEQEQWKRIRKAVYAEMEGRE